MKYIELPVSHLNKYRRQSIHKKQISPNTSSTVFCLPKWILSVYLCTTCNQHEQTYSFTQSLYEDCAKDVFGAMGMYEREIEHHQGVLGKYGPLWNMR
jgi:hypothetical protein